MKTNKGLKPIVLAITSQPVPGAAVIRLTLRVRGRGINYSQQKERHGTKSLYYSGRGGLDPSFASTALNRRSRFSTT